MPISSGFTAPTGKENVLSSFNQFLVDQIGGGQIHDGISTTLSAGKTFWWLFDQPLTGLMFPSISTTEVGLFSRSPSALGKFLGYDSNGDAIKGGKNQTLIQIDCWAKDTAEQANATQQVRRFRDKVVYILQNAGDIDESTGLPLIPAIQLKDYNAVGTPVRGLIKVDDADNAIDEKFLIDPVDQEVRRYRLLVRVFWYELQK